MPKSVDRDSKYDVLLNIDIPASMIESWQQTIDLMAKVVNVPTGLVMRVHKRQIEVLVASRNKDNVYEPGERADLDTGLYCETVMDTREQLVVPDALADPLWENNPDVKLDMISYLGVPLAWPSGQIFGTVCVLDRTANKFNQQYIELVRQFRDAVQLGLQTLFENRKLEQTHLELERQMLEAWLLHKTAQLAEVADTEKEAFQSVVNVICEMTKWSIGHIYVPSPTNPNLLVSTSIWHLSDPDKFAVFREVTERTNFSIGVGLPGRILKTGEPAWITNVEIDPNFPRNKLARSLGVKGAFGFPVKVSGDIVAVLEFFAEDKVEPDERLLRIMRSVGIQLGSLFERLRAEKKLKLAYEERRKKNQELRSALEELTTTQTELVQSEKMAVLGKITAGVAHELNSPIGAIKSAADVSGRCVSKIHEVVKTTSSLQDATDIEIFRKSLSILAKSTENIASGSDRISKIVASLKGFSRLDEAAFQQVDLHEGIESTLILIQYAIKDGTRIVKDFSNLPKFFCNPGEMNQVFMTLLTMAIEAVAEEGTITIRTFVDEDNIRVEIADTGKGIPPETLETIFDLNFRTKDQRVGMGLELPNAYNIILRLGGDLKVESEIGKGTKFTIVLPLSD